ncbi:hypothetical protein QBC39DRAFT_351867 [Podospora conica]|nr:hypothetical protein QBC39DRAFT_351867 [Schizothecium conicum]
MVSLFVTNEELLKKDDDHKPTKLPSMRSPWAVARAPQRKTLKRVGIATVLLAIVFLFFSNIPTDVPIRYRRPGYIPGDGSQFLRPASGPPRTMPKAGKPMRAPNWSGKPKEAAPKEQERVSAPPGGYDGPIQFTTLGGSLSAISDTGGDSAVNRNVLFAASSLQSVALLLPIACQMGAELRVYVHFAVMSRSDMTMDEFREVNGVDKSCHIIFHDARPDHAADMSEMRFSKTVLRAMYHINYYVHPQAVIVDASSSESGLFTEAMRVQTRSMSVPLIELPENSAQQLGWLTKLDSASLAAWDKLNIDILIHAAPGTSGNLIRLLKSLAAADFSASPAPHLTIELPNKVDAATASFLETFQWPPAGVYNPTNVRQLTLRHRIHHKGVTEEDSTIRFLESFWPTNPKNSHVLVLSPQAELSPWFFHYVKYTALEYLHSTAAVTQQWDARLFGISLNLPTTHLDATKPFTPPKSPKSASPTNDAPFLWQAPNSDAVLYTGQKWTELHAFASRLLETRQSPLPAIFTDKRVSKRFPSWLEHALKLCRARGYWTLYPSPTTARNLAVVHSELYRAPEEYEDELRPAGSRTGGGRRKEGILAPGPLLDSLPGGGELPGFDDMALLAWDGRAMTLGEVDRTAEKYAGELRRAVGGCERLTVKELGPRADAGDLFCIGEEGV